MASFTDNVGQLTHYTPYISTNPTEAMLYTGKALEEQYQEGLSKVNSYVSSLNGLDFAKKGAKEYVDRQLNNLKTGLSKSLAGDFSNQSLVNQVGGAARTIANDPVVETNLMATANHKSNLTNITQAQKEGKSDAANEDDYFSNFTKWVNDGKLDTPFNAQFIPYHDVFKKLGEIAKSVGEDSNIVQNLFITDANGNPVLKDGNLQYNDVMAESLLKGKDKNKLLSAFQSGLDGSDYKQLSITGKYNLKGVTPDQLSSSLDESFKQYEKSYLGQSEYLKNKILELKTKGGKDSEAQIDNINQQLLNIQNNYNNRKESTEQDKKLAFTNPDDIKSKLYTNNYLDSISSALSNTEKYTKYSKNPAIEMMLDRQRTQIAVNTDKRLADEFLYKKQHDKEQMDFEMFKLMKGKGKNPDGTTNTNTLDMRDAPIPTEENSTQMTDNFQNGLKEDMNSQFELSKKVAIAHWKAINSINGNNLSDDDILKGMEGYAKKLGLSTNDYIIMQAEKAKDNFYDTKNSIIGNEYEDDFNNLQKLNTTIGQKKLILDNKDKVIQEEAKKQGFDIVNLDKLDLKPITTTLTVGGGGYGDIRNEKVTLSKQDVYDLATWINHNNEGTLPSFMDSKSITDKAEKAKKNLISKYGDAGFQSMQKLYGDNHWDWGDVNPLYLVTAHNGEKQNSEVAKALKNINSDVWKKTNKLTEDYFRNSGQVNIPKIVPLSTSTAEDRHSSVEKITSVLTDFGGNYLDLISKVAEPESQFQVNINPPQSKNGQSTYSLQVSDKKGNVETRDINEDQYKYITGNSPLTIAENTIDNSIKVSPFKSTNLSYNYTDPDAHKGAMLKHSDFKNVKNYNIAMDFVKSSSGGYYPKMYYKDGDNWKLIQLYNGIQGFQGLSKQDMLAFPSSIDDEVVSKLIESLK